MREITSWVLGQIGRKWWLRADARLKLSYSWIIDYKFKLRADALKSATCIMVPVQNNTSTVKNIVAAQQIDTSETATRRPADL